MSAISVSIKPAKGGVKKYTALFRYDDGSKKTVHFGDRRYQDYTQHGDIRRRDDYIRRHGGEKNGEPIEDWESPDNAGSLSAWLLWGESTSFKDNLKEYKDYFELKTGK
jgi:hypothetical protein